MSIEGEQPLLPNPKKQRQTPKTNRPHKNSTTIHKTPRKTEKTQKQPM